jgi:peptide/nickel transport system ATP-binding protein/Fe3+-transporting ATPase
MLSGEHIGFRYGPQMPWVLRGVDISVAPGEVVGLSGPSGRGKTTLSKILAGYLASSEGQVLLDGQPLPRRGYCPIQLIFQHPELAVNPRWRIGEILHEGHAPASALLRDLSIDDSWLSRWPHELSGGELQRVAVARALGPSTRYVIADEMTAMLDANTQAQIWHTVIAHARAQQLGVLVVSHEQTLLERLCSRLISMDVTTGHHV